MNARERIICFGQVKSSKQQNACIYTSDLQITCVYIYTDAYIYTNNSWLVFRLIFEFSLGYW